jgi:hypothetical protein
MTEKTIETTEKALEMISRPPQQLREERERPGDIGDKLRVRGDSPLFSRGATGKLYILL